MDNKIISLEEILSILYEIRTYDIESDEFYDKWKNEYCDILGTAYAEKVDNRFYNRNFVISDIYESISDWFLFYDDDWKFDIDELIKNLWNLLRMLLNL